MHDSAADRALLTPRESGAGQPDACRLCAQALRVGSGCGCDSNKCDAIKRKSRHSLARDIFKNCTGSSQLAAECGTSLAAAADLVLG